MEEGNEDNLSVPLLCPSCPEAFSDNNLLIRHLLKEHCVYTGLICPYCTGHHPKRFLDLQSHVTGQHLDKLTGYDVANSCKVCKAHFNGYAELRDHVQQHGDMFRYVKCYLKNRILSLLKCALHILKESARS